MGLHYSQTLEPNRPKQRRHLKRPQHLECLLLPDQTRQNWFPNREIVETFKQTVLFQK